MSDPKSKPENVRINQRDLAIFAGLFESRVMQRKHLTALYFDGSDAAAKERIGKKLLPAEYLAEVNPDRHPTEKAVYGLGRKGFEELKERLLIDRYEELVNRRFTWERLEDRLKVRPLTIEHELAVMDVKAALVTAFRSDPTLSVGDFLTWPLLYQFRAGGIRGESYTKPDGYLRLAHSHDDETWEKYFFLEIDRGTEVLDTLLGKIADYRAYNGSAAFSRFLGTGPTEAIRFRALFIFGQAKKEAVGAEERRNDFLHRVFQETPERFSIWATTIHDLVRDPLGAIWMRPFDYEQALVGTPYDPKETSWQPKNGRNSARDQRIALQASRHSLLVRSSAKQQAELSQEPVARVLPFPASQLIPVREQTAHSIVTTEQTGGGAAPAVVMAPVDLREKEHRYLRHLIVRLAESRGFDAKLQDMSESNQMADLILKRDATTIYCLITLSTTPDDEVARIKKCGEAGCSRVLVVSPDRDRRSLLTGVQF